MARRLLIPKTLTIRRDQAQYLEDTGIDNREQSRWFRGAIDMRMEHEQKMKLDVDEKVSVQSPEKENS